MSQDRGSRSTENSPEKASPGALRPLNLPVSIAVEEDARGRPLTLILRGRKLKVASIDDLWEIDEEWWREKPVVRMYYQATTEDGRPITLFRDLTSGEWYRQRD